MKKRPEYLVVEVGSPMMDNPAHAGTLNECEKWAESHEGKWLVVQIWAEVTTTATTTLESKTERPSADDGLSA